MEAFSLELVPWIRSWLRLLHFAGIILGVGASTLLDLIIFRFVLIKRIEATHIRIIIFSSQIITIGLAVLWISGIGLLTYYWFYDAGKLHNPKLLAKIIIVGVLSLNAFLVHFFVLPKVTTQIGQHLLDGLSRSHCVFLIFIGTVSAISWYVPLILGIVPQFNNTIPVEIILASYAAMILTVNVVIQIVLVIMQQQHPPGAPPTAKTSVPRKF